MEIINDKTEIYYKQSQHYTKGHLKSCDFLKVDYDIVSKLCHDNIIKYDKLCQNVVDKEGNWLCQISMKKYEKDMFQYFQDNDYTKEQLKFYFTKLIDALGYIHSQNIAHNDLKPENIFVNVKTQEIVLGDFGEAVELNQKHQENKINFIRSFKMKQSLFLGPEVYEIQFQNEEEVVLDEIKLDIFSFGMIFYLFIFRTLPKTGGKSLNTKKDDFIYKNVVTKNFEIFKQVTLQNCQANLSEYSDDEINQILELVMKMIAYDAQERPTAQCIIQNHYFQKI